MQRNILFLLICSMAMIFVACNNNSSYTIKGELKNAEAEWVYLMALPDRGEPTVMDSAKVSGNRFEFTGVTDSLVRCGIFTQKPAYRPDVIIYLENTGYMVSVDAKNTSVNSAIGGNEQTVYNQFLDIENREKVVTDSLGNVYNYLVDNRQKIGDETYHQEFSRYLAGYANATRTFSHEKLDLIEQHLDKLCALDQFAKVFRFMIPTDALKLANRFVTPASDVSILKILKNELELRTQLVGKPAPELTATTPGGESVSLSSFKGKVVILDWWASWCRPCRDEAPNLRKLYDAYADKGLEIVGFSLDTDKHRWVEAIADDNLVWTQISDLKGLKGTKSEIAESYGIRAIPNIMMIDRNGIVIEENLRGANIEVAVKRHLLN